RPHGGAGDAKRNAAGGAAVSEPALPSLVLLRQQYPHRALADPVAAAREALAAARLEGRLRSGMRVGVGAGSRGIANYAAIVAEACRHLRALGCQPFIFPCMGSHGGATAAGQLDVLRSAGITEAAMGAPILSEIQPHALGASGRVGLPVYMDRHAWEADAFLLINRIKPHTDFSGAIESGICKMLAMGIGKHRGAQAYHAHAIQGGRYEEAIREASATVIATGKCLGGLALLEDAYHQTARVEWLAAADLPGQEETLLALAKSWQPRIPVAALDLLIVDEIGKEISGAGMDTKVVNRGVHGEVNAWPTAAIQRIYLRGLSARTYGNAVGVGMAEGVSRPLAQAIDWAATRVNSLTASTPRNARLPLVFDSDREAVAALLATVGLASNADAKIGWIRNTLEIATLALSENLVSEAREQIACEAVGEPFALGFDAGGTLASPFATATAAAH
ncbi:MAG: hypothetical protein ACRD2E_14055, partial [Terriglobales bacterium]